jgi:hypothetical protein
MAVPTRITVAEMRRRFNEGKYWERTQAGELDVVVIDQGTPRADVLEKHPGAVSQMISIRDRATKDELARAHMYLLPDGAIGASGRPDPKRLYEDGIHYHLKRTGKKAKADS